MKKLLFTVILFFLIQSPISHALEGKVVSVAGGDLFTILTPDKQKVVIRLYGIDSPENDQAYGEAAKKATSRMVSCDQIEIIPKSVDKHGRTVGVALAGNTNVNKELIRRGYAWQHREYCQDAFCDSWLKYEQEAREAGRGLWAGPAPIAPWDWSKGERNNSNKGSVYGQYHGDTKSRVFHGASCLNYHCENCVKGFDSISKATQSGYRPHKGCVQ